MREPVEPGAGVALALAIAAGSLLLWLVNPFAGLLAVPAAHLWMLTVLTRPAPPRRLRAVLIGLGLAPAVLVAIYYLFALHMDPLHGAWYLLMLVTGHSVGIVLSLIGCLMLAAACGTAEIAWRLPDDNEAEQGPRDQRSMARARTPDRAHSAALSRPFGADWPDVLVSGAVWRENRRACRYPSCTRRYRMDRREVDRAFKRTVARSGYVVDPRAVAEAILRSGVLVAAQPRNRSVRSEEDKALSG